MTQYRAGVLENFEWQQAVDDRVTQPTGAESKGHRYLITTGAGDFAGEDGNIATAKQDNPADAGDWYFDDKREGMTVYVKDEDLVYQYITSWLELRISCLFDADRDTGIEVEQSADEDKIHFKTAGTERMIIDDVGNVGIGTDSPTAKIHVAQAEGLSNLNVFLENYTDDDRASAIFFRKSNSDTLGTLVETTDGQTLGFFVFQGVDSGSNFDYGARIDAIQDGNSGTRVPTNLIFATWSDSAKNENQLVLHNDGYIGIGLDDPVAVLEIENSSGNLLYLRRLSESENFGAWFKLGVDTTYYKAAIGFVRIASTNGLGDLLFCVDSNDDAANVGSTDVKLIIKNDGKVGIGTDSPSARLEIEVPSNGNQQALLIEQLDTTNNPVCAEINNDGTNYGLYIHQDGVLESSKYGLYVYSNAVQANASLINFTQDNATSSRQVLVIGNDGTGSGIYIVQNGVLAGDGALKIYSNAIQVNASLFQLQQENASSTYMVMYIDNNGTGQGLRIRQDGNGIAQEIDNNGTNHGLYIHQDGVLAASKFGLYVYSNAVQINMPLAYFHQDNSSSTTGILELQNDGTGVGFYITQSGNGVAQTIVNSGSKHGLYINQADVLDTSNYGLYVYSNAIQSGTSLVRFINNNASSTADTFDVYNNGAGHCVSIQQNGVLAASKYGLYLYSNAIQNASPLAYFLQDNASSDQDLLVLKQDGTGNALNITAGKLKLPNGGAINEFSTDGTMAGNSDDAVPTEKAIVTYVGTGVGVKSYSDGSLIEASADTERSTGEVSYTKLKEFTPLVRQGTITVSWEMKRLNGAGNNTVYAKVYINGVATGAEESTTSTVYVSKSTSSISVNVGDVVQIYGYSNASPMEMYIQNTKIKCSNPTSVQEASGY